MTRAQVDASMDGLPMAAVRQPGTAEHPLHDKAVNDGPTTMNGPLTGRPATMGDRLITAAYRDGGAAAAARRALIDAGVSDRAIVVGEAADDAGLASQTEAPDPTLLGKLREAVLAPEYRTFAREAVRKGYVILHVHPGPAEVETVVRVLEATDPVHFDADLERWRNKT